MPLEERVRRLEHQNRILTALCVLLLIGVIVTLGRSRARSAEVPGTATDVLRTQRIEIADAAGHVLIALGATDTAAGPAGAITLSNAKGQRLLRLTQNEFGTGLIAVEADGQGLLQLDGTPQGEVTAGRMLASCVGAFSRLGLEARADNAGGSVAVYNAEAQQVLRLHPHTTDASGQLVINDARGKYLLGLGAGPDGGGMALAFNPPGTEHARWPGPTDPEPRPAPQEITP